MSLKSNAQDFQKQAEELRKKMEERERRTDDAISMVTDHNLRTLGLKRFRDMIREFIKNA